MIRRVQQHASAQPYRGAHGAEKNMADHKDYLTTSRGVHFFFLASLWLGIHPTIAAESRPNILWITFEDISPDLGCYGVEYANTPNLDRFAEESVRYTRAWSNAGMCSPARATLITGMYPPGTGAQNMRSEVLLPDFVRGFPEYLRRAGYFTSNHVKTDYNWKAPAETWSIQSRDWVNDGWRKREGSQPFFTVINVTDTHSSQLYWRGEDRYRRRIEELGAANDGCMAGLSDTNKIVGPGGPRRNFALQVARLPPGWRR